MFRKKVNFYFGTKNEIHDLFLLLAQSNPLSWEKPEYLEKAHLSGLVTIAAHYKQAP